MSVDHAAEAITTLEGAGDGRNFATDASVAAVAHAVLAAAEQLRIRNLIALAGLQGPAGFENEVYDARLGALMEGLLDREEVAAVPGYGPAGIDERVFIRPEIAKALGL